ncbi:hypothetical protein L873DRAFT_1797870 [Choiromyces venosus 120613-1]|uniref:Uncharacterized protein n=1 Tax=Choiromyces venosus 120613-1 TaxID=1336337 RepID=A0A3N4KAP4_9PEZI|nr:hypothetical protein L873DRAFT_1797870 [Choiromyces venosus 120613-1]
MAMNSLLRLQLYLFLTGLFWRSRPNEGKNRRWETSPRPDGNWLAVLWYVDALCGAFVGGNLYVRYLDLENCIETQSPGPQPEIYLFVFRR